MIVGLTLVCWWGSEIDAASNVASKSAGWRTTVASNDEGTEETDETDETEEAEEMSSLR